MSCCDNKDNCYQGRNCEIQAALAEQRVTRIKEWLLNNYSLVSNSGIIIVAFVAAIIWLIK